jgi:hypothetical protein
MHRLNTNGTKTGNASHLDTNGTKTATVSHVCTPPFTKNPQPTDKHHPVDLKSRARHDCCFEFRARFQISVCKLTTHIFSGVSLALPWAHNGTVTDLIRLCQPYNPSKVLTHKLYERIQHCNHRRIHTDESFKLHWLNDIRRLTANTREPVKLTQTKKWRHKH